MASTIWYYTVLTFESVVAPFTIPFLCRNEVAVAVAPDEIKSAKPAFIPNSLQPDQIDRRQSSQDRIMVTRLTRAVPIALAVILSAGAAFAQSSAPAKTDTGPAATTAPAPKASQPRSAQSIECSKEADAKGLHGKERKKFRSECKKQINDKTKT